MEFDQLKRREFITLLAGTATWSLAARAQQAERMRRIGVLMNWAAGDPLGQARLAGFQQALQQLSWSDGRNVQIDIRWHENDADRARNDEIAPLHHSMTPIHVLRIHGSFKGEPQ
jgi:putative ABC transport system substrate-binding protein